MHEEQVHQLLTHAIHLLQATTTNETTLRILEIGIGTDCRTIRHGMYSSLRNNNDPIMAEFTGMDLPNNIPTDETILQEIQTILFPSSNTNNNSDTFQVVPGDITNTNTDIWQDGYFDLITCSLVLCSVSSVQLALQEIHRLLHPTHGIFAYVEHIAASSNNNNSCLEYQQILLDPLQQLVAHNCHLHRPTNQLIQQQFTTTDNKTTNAKII